MGPCMQGPFKEPQNEACSWKLYPQNISGFKAKPSAAQNYNPEPGAPQSELHLARSGLPLFWSRRNEKGLCFVFCQEIPQNTIRLSLGICELLCYSSPRHRRISREAGVFDVVCSAFWSRQGMLPTLGARDLYCNPAGIYQNQDGSVRTRTRVGRNLLPDTALHAVPISGWSQPFNRLQEVGTWNSDEVCSWCRYLVGLDQSHVPTF